MLSGEIHSEGLEESHPTQQHHAKVWTHQIHKQGVVLDLVIWDTKLRGSCFTQQIRHLFNCMFHVYDVLPDPNVGVLDLSIDL